MPVARQARRGALFGRAAVTASSSRLLLLSGLMNLSCRSTRPVTFAPASSSIFSTPSVCSRPLGRSSTSTRRPVSLPGRTTCAISAAKSSSMSSSFWRLLTDWRICELSLRSALTFSLSESATGPLRAAVPTTRPIANARKTAVRDTTW